MGKVFNKYKLTSLAVLFTAVILSAVRVVVLMNNVEINTGTTDNHYLISINKYTVSFSVVAAVAAVIILIWAFTSCSKNIKVFEPLTPGFLIDLSLYPSSVLFTSALSGFMLLSSGLYFVFHFALEVQFSVWMLVLSVLMIAASLGFLYSSFIAKGKTAPTVSVWLKILPVFFAIYWLMYEFIDQNKYAINSSSVFHIGALILLMLFFTYEAQNAAGKLRPKFFCAIALLAVLFMLIDAVPNLMLSCFWMFGLDALVLMDAVELVLALYIFAKVYSISIPEDTNSLS